MGRLRDIVKNGRRGRGVASGLRRGLMAGAAMLGSLGLYALIPSQAAHATGPTALLDGDTVSVDSTANTGVSGYTCSNESVEQCDLEQQGYTVTVVDGATWASMTASQFASYQLLALGDPTCSTDPSALDAPVSNESTWAPVVDGNDLIVGTDPIYHYGNGGDVAGAGTLVYDGLRFAGGETGKTGLYLDLSCYYDTGSSAPQDSPILDGIETGFQLQSETVCDNNIDVVATNPFLTGLTNTDLSNWSCSVHEYASKWPSDFIPIAIDTDAVSPSYTAPDGSKGDPYILGRGAGLAAGNISLTPASGSQATGSDYSLTATVQSGGAPLSGATVTFTCTSGPNSGKTATATTATSGQATETYSSSTAGTDTWTASFVDDSSHTEVSNSATVTWTGATTTTVPPTTTTTTAPAPVQKAISGATTVHTGMVWAGSRPVELALSMTGLAFVGLGLRQRRRRATAAQRP